MIMVKEEAVTNESRSQLRWFELSGSARTTAAVVFGVLLAFTRNLTLPGTALVLVGGVAVWMIDPDPDLAEVPALTDGPPGLTLAPEGADLSAMVAGLVTWGLLSLVFLLWEAAAFFLGNNDAHPTFSMLSDPFFAFPPTRALAGLGWLLWGWHLRAT